MVDVRLVELLRDCDLYIERQFAILDGLAAANVADPFVAAMDAALDQLIHGVTVQRRQLERELTRDHTPKD
jgi:predicted YcjX-like family ATPase